MFEEDSHTIRLGCRALRSSIERAMPAALDEVGTCAPVRDSEPILVLLAALNGCMMRCSFPALSASGTAFFPGIQKGETP